MKLWQVCFVFAALSIHSWDSITYVNATGKNLRGNLLERELQYVAQIHDKLKDTSGCNDVAVLNMSFDSERWKNEALMAVNVANLLTSLWSVNSSAIAESIVENDIFFVSNGSLHRPFLTICFRISCMFRAKLVQGLRKVLSLRVQGQEIERKHSCYRSCANGRLRLLFEPKRYLVDWNQTENQKQDVNRLDERDRFLFSRKREWNCRE